MADARHGPAEGVPLQNAFQDQRSCGPVIRRGIDRSRQAERIVPMGANPPATVNGRATTHARKSR
jgi:hypothetical protein